MDASDGLNKPGTPDPLPVSPPSTAAPSTGGPVKASAQASSGAAETSTAPPVQIKRKKNGTFQKGVSGNPKGNYKRTPNLNSKLIKVLGNFKLTDANGATFTFLEAMLRRALAEPVVLAKLLDKILVDASPPAEALKIMMQQNANPMATAGASATSTSNTNDRFEELERLGLRGDFCDFVDRLAAGRRDARAAR